MKCHHCGAPTTNGLALCDMAQAKASADLEFLPVYFRNLARYRPGRAGARPVPGSREPTYDSTSRDRVGRALDEAEADIAGWAQCLADDRGVELPMLDNEGQQVAALCRLLTEQLTSIATLEWCGEFVRQMDHHEAKLCKLTEVVAPGWYAGSCRHCSAPTYVVPGLTWVKCLSCGCTTYARDHLEIILDEARDWVARPKHLADALVALIDTEMSSPRLDDRIRQWAARGQIDPVRRLDRDGDEVGPKRYRLGQVLDRLMDCGPTRATVPDPTGAVA